MRLLLDTNILIAVMDEKRAALQPPIRDAITAPAAAVHASVASLWEIAIKARLRKLAVAMPLLLIPEFIQRMGLQLIVIDQRHVLTDVEPQPATRDPFDRLLLAQCQIENLRLVTIDRTLAAHPLAWRADQG